MSTAAGHHTLPAPALTDPVDRTRFPVDEWRLVETAHDATDLGVTETLFAVGNGYLGLRGNPEEGRDSHTHGTYINGFHETWEIRHAEEAFGLAKAGQTMVDVPDPKVIKLYVDDEPLLLDVADLEDYERELDFREGILRRRLVWRTSAGKRLQVVTTRMVSLEERHVAVMTMDVEMLDGDASLVISSALLNRQDGSDEYHVKSAAMGEGMDPRRGTVFGRRVLEPILHKAFGNRMVTGHRCVDSGMTVTVNAEHLIETENDYDDRVVVDADLAKHTFRVDARQGRPIRLQKFVVYHSSRGVPVRELGDRCRRTLDRALETGVDRLRAAQRANLQQFWDHADVTIAGHPDLQQAVRWNLFQLHQATARAGTRGIPAKGVTGSGYEGHYFWDTECYVVPFLTYTDPQAARNSLRFRHSLLPEARERAELLAHRGAMFPWRTINGQEASAYYAAGTAQYHINADIAYAVDQYVRATGDTDLLLHEGLDILVETARLWEDLGFWRHNGDRLFHIHGVTGPDEYTTVVNDNLFTNVMARYNLFAAVAAVTELRGTDPAGYARAVRRLGLREEEVQDWRRAAEGMFIPFDHELGVHPQDLHFLEKEVWDLERTPEDKRPLLLHFHPLVIYRYQVLKQADVVLAMYLAGDQFTVEQKRANFDYYDPITTGDSSLSAVVQAIVAAEVGYHEMAMRYFHAGLFVDLADLHGNTSEGVHVASAGGVWSALVSGFGGMRDYGGVLTFDPRLPQDWEELCWRICWRGSRLRVRLTPRAITFRVEDGDPVEVRVRDERFLVRSETVSVPLLDQGPRIDGVLGSSPIVGVRASGGYRLEAAVPYGATRPRR